MCRCRFRCCSPQQVARAPEAVAISCGVRSWTYREVDESSNRLAHLLVGRGVGPGERVGLLLPRSAQAVVAMLGVLKTGAAYVPLDPAHPDARIGFVLGDAAPAAVLTTAELGWAVGWARIGDYRCGGFRGRCAAGERVGGAGSR